MKGLDIGTAFIVCMEQDEDGGGQKVRSERDAFFEVPPGEMTKNMLNESGVNYVKLNNKLYVIGDKAMEFSEVFGSECRRPLSRGYISPREQEAIPILNQIIKAVAGRKKAGVERIVFSVPADTIDDMKRQSALVYHRESLVTILQLLGYDPVPINEGLAVIYSELKDYQFSGIGISFGAGMVNFCASWLSVPIPELTFALGRGGDWIDIMAAQALDENVSIVCGMKESPMEFSLDKKYDSGIPQALTIYYKELIRYTILYLEDAFRKTKRRFPRPIPIVISGGTTSPNGFLELFTEMIRASSFSNFKGERIEIGDIIQARNPLYAVSQGCLIKGIIE